MAHKAPVWPQGTSGWWLCCAQHLRAASAHAATPQVMGKEGGEAGGVLGQQGRERVLGVPGGAR